MAQSSISQMKSATFYPVDDKKKQQLWKSLAGQKSSSDLLFVHSSFNITQSSTDTVNLDAILMLNEKGALPPS